MDGWTNRLVAGRPDGWIECLIDQLASCSLGSLVAWLLVGSGMSKV